MGSLQIEVSHGEVIDKITILRIKRDKIDDPDKLAHVERELATLEAAWSASGLAWPDGEAEALQQVNLALWDVEDELRRHEARGEFDALFVERARSVYRINDRRAALKRTINEQLGSDLVEVKDYVAYP
ncbi:MAG: DUF6165 family protein [Myxococcota bacterium]